MSVNTFSKLKVHFQRIQDAYMAGLSEHNTGIDNTNFFLPSLLCPNVQNLPASTYKAHEIAWHPLVFVHINQMR